MITQKINSFTVKPVKIPKVDPKSILGHDLFPDLYPNIFICAKKNSGKSTVIWNILKQCTGKDTRIVIFSATVHKDDTYKKIIEHFEKKGNTVITYTSIKEDGVDNLKTIMEMMQGPEEQSEEEEEESEEQGKPVLIFHDTPKRRRRKKKKPKKPKKMAPNIIFVLDDLSTELRYPSVATLLKSNRHYKSKVIMSSQHVMDLVPASRRQLDYMLLFAGHDTKKLELIKEDLDLSIPEEVFFKLYQNATDQKFSFLYIDTRRGEFRKRFNEKYLV